jgi:hypothetical protein
VWQYKINTMATQRFLEYESSQSGPNVVENNAGNKAGTALVGEVGKSKHARNA